jgi:hypothetical protein
MSNVLRCRPFDMISRHASLCQARRTTPHQGSRRLRRRDVVYSKDTRRQPQYPEDSLIVTYRIWTRAIHVPSLTFVLRLQYLLHVRSSLLYDSHSRTVRLIVVRRLLIVSISLSKISELLRFLRFSDFNMTVSISPCYTSPHRSLSCIFAIRRGPIPRILVVCFFSLEFLLSRVSLDHLCMNTS